MSKTQLINLVILLFVTSHINAANQTHTDIKTGDAIIWLDVKDMPPGAKVSLLSGDPNKPGHFVARVKFPANYIVPAHSHSINEFDTVISGTYYLGTGKVADANKGTPLRAGDFAMIPAKMKHYGYTKEDTVLQISGDGPSGMIYDSNG